MRPSHPATVLTPSPAPLPTRRPGVGLPAALALAWLTIGLVLMGGAWAAPARLGLPRLFLDEQDAPVLAGLIAAALAWAGLEALARRRRGGSPAATDAPPLDLPSLSPAWPAPLLAVLVGAIAWTGWRLVCQAFPLSLDEFMADFGARVFARGALMARPPPEWRPYLAAMSPTFTVRTAAGWWSAGYLPVNSALRALAGLTGEPALAGPVMAGVSILLTHRIARRLWPQRPGVALASAVLLATSSQLVIAAMSPYAMTAHLALNLLWLELILAGGRVRHAAAMAVAFLACGLHQLIFHPLFAAPFVLQMAVERRWSAALAHSLAYAAIGAFWTAWWPIALSLTPAAGPAAAAAGAAGPLAQAAALLGAFDPSDLGMMAANLVRLATWQNPLTAPLVVLGAWSAWRAGGAVRALLLGLVLTLAAMAVLEPYQGHGWGYRYLHGLLGSAALLAAWTWDRLAAGRPGARAAFTAAALVGALVLLPLRAWQAHGFIAPYAGAEAAVRAARAEVVLVDDTGAWFTLDLVRNDPWTPGRPVVMDLTVLRPDQLEALCRGHSLAVFSRGDAGAFGIRRFSDPRTSAMAEPRLARLRGRACGPAAEPVADVFGGPF